MNRFVYGASRRLLLLACKVLFRLRARGVEHVPDRGPFLLVGNHASFLDPPLAGVVLRRPIRFFMRSSLARFPVCGWWFRQVGVLMVDRAAPRRGEIQQAVDALRSGDPVMVFPEGTRTATGAVGEFKRGMLLILRQAECPVVPVGIAGSFRAWPRSRRLPRLFRRCEVTYGAALTAAEVLADGGLAELRRRVAELAGLPRSDQRTLRGDPTSSRVSFGEPGPA
jgi:1-acyl-sn-glycerol-3-phosphate acyltransferase